MQGSLFVHLLKAEIQQAPCPSSNVRVMKLCSVESHDDDADLTPIRRTRKKEIHKHHPLVQECRRLKSEGLSLVHIAIASGIEPVSIEKWDRKGWLEPVARKRRSGDESLAALIRPEFLEIQIAA